MLKYNMSYLSGTCTYMYIDVHACTCTCTCIYMYMYVQVQVMLYILFSRSDEFDWLEHSGREAADQRCCHGDVGRVEEEIVRQQVMSSLHNHQLCT